MTFLIIAEDAEKKRKESLDKDFNRCARIKEAFLMIVKEHLL